MLVHVAVVNTWLGGEGEDKSNQKKAAENTAAQGETERERKKGIQRATSV